MWRLLFLLTSGSDAMSRLDPVVETDLGLIRGLRASDGNYSMFLGIPYAMVNESNPFGASLPYPKFEETFEAFDDSAVCPQIEEFGNTITGTLDCLHLNIYVPHSATPFNPLPVLVWIYGGAFDFGFAGRFLYGPKYLVRHDVILVTFNYRVGPYGFMCLDIPEIPGNQGLKDQLAGLRWIKQHITAFGGDVNQITIFGDSAGGASVDFQLISEHEKLYNKVIIQSGTASGPWAIVPSDPTAPLQISKHLGLDTNNLDEAISFLAGIDSGSVIGAVSELTLELGPCVEKDFDGVETFLADYPVNTAIPKANTISILIGFNNDEQVIEYANKSSEDYIKEKFLFKEKLAEAFDFGDDLEEMSDYVRRFYIGDKEISENVARELTDFLSDFDFVHPVQRSIAKYLENDAKIVYLYKFSYVGERNFAKKRYNVTQGGASHADEISYLFDISYEVDITPEDQLILDRMTTLWTNFAKYGDPTPETSDLVPEKWLPVTRESLNYLNIDLSLMVGSRPFNRRLSFWDLFYNMNKKAIKGYRDET